MRHNSLLLASRITQPLLRHDGVAASVAASPSVGAAIGDAQLPARSGVCENLKACLPVAQ
jgi:hypothetical protein